MSRGLDPDEARLLAALDGVPAPAASATVAPPRADHVQSRLIVSALDAGPGDHRPLRGDALRRAWAARTEATDGMPWPDDWFGPADSGEAQQCRKLWVYTFSACFSDEIRGLVKDADKAAVRKRCDWSEATRQALRHHSWIGSLDFAEVTFLAGLDPAAVLSVFRRALRSRAALLALADRVRGDKGQGRRSRSNDCE